MVVGCITTYAISAYHHLRCEFESCSWRGILDITLCDDLSSEVIVCFVDIGGIVDHHYLNFLFMMLLCHQSICVSRKPVTSNSSVAFKFVKLSIYIILFGKVD
jgi:hypothetical protein